MNRIKEKWRNLEKKIGTQIASAPFFIADFFAWQQAYRSTRKLKKPIEPKTGSTEEFRKLGMEEAFFQVLAKTDHEKRGRLYAIYFLENSLFPQDNEKELF